MTKQMFQPSFLGFKNFFDAFEKQSQVPNSPVVSLEEKEESFELEIELPGVRKEDIDIQMENNILSVTALRKKGTSELNYKRNFKISEEVDSENVQASYENGLLTLALKKKKQPEAKKIQVL